MSSMDNTEWKSCSHTQPLEFAHSPKKSEGHHSAEQTLHMYIHSFQKQHNSMNHTNH